MEKNLLNFAALSILCVLHVMYYRGIRTPLKRYTLYHIMLVLATVSTTASICNNALPGIAPNWLLYTSNTLYFASHSLLPLALLFYVQSLTDFDLADWRKLVPAALPNAVALLLVLTSWFSRELFYLDAGGVYHRGPLLVLMYAVTAVNFIIIGTRLLHLKRVTDRDERLSIQIYLSLSVTAVGIQLVFPNILIENLASAICLLYSQFTVQSPWRIMDPDTGMLNETGFRGLVEPLFRKGVSFRIGFLQVEDYAALERSGAGQDTQTALRKLAAYLFSHNGCIFARIDGGSFCFLREDLGSDVAWDMLIADLEEIGLSQHFPEDSPIPLRLKLGTVTVPQDAAGYEDFRRLLASAEAVPMPGSRTFCRLDPEDYAAQ